MRRALLPLQLLPLQLGLWLQLGLRLLPLRLGLWLPLLLSIWIATSRRLDPWYTNKVHGASGVVPSCSIVLGPSLDIGVIVMPVGVVDERPR